LEARTVKSAIYDCVISIGLAPTVASYLEVLDSNVSIPTGCSVVLPISFFQQTSTFVNLGVGDFDLS
jgi:hypothetical protein